MLVSLRTASSLLSHRLPRSFLVPGEGLEPSLPKERDFKSLVSTDFTIQAQEFKPDHFIEFSL